jgi:hypothetical protein
LAICASVFLHLLVLRPWHAQSEGDRRVRELELEIARVPEPRPAIPNRTETQNPSSAAHLALPGSVKSLPPTPRPRIKIRESEFGSIPPPRDFGSARGGAPASTMNHAHRGAAGYRESAWFSTFMNDRTATDYRLRFAHLVTNRAFMDRWCPDPVATRRGEGAAVEDAFMAMGRYYLNTDQPASFGEGRFEFPYRRIGEAKQSARAYLMSYREGRHTVAALCLVAQCNLREANDREALQAYKAALGEAALRLHAPQEEPVLAALGIDLLRFARPRGGEITLEAEATHSPKSTLSFQKRRVKASFSRGALRR